MQVKKTDDFVFPWLVLEQRITEMKILALSGPSNVLPRCALPKYFTEELQKHIPNAIFSSNPCRSIFSLTDYWKTECWLPSNDILFIDELVIAAVRLTKPILVFECRVKFYTQEIVFFCQDLLYRMRRSCLIPPSTEETNDPFEHVHPPLLSLCPPLPLPPFPAHSLCMWVCFCWHVFINGYWSPTCVGFDFLLQLVATITHQSHLCPLPLTVQPIIWNYDHSLHLYPTPHTVLLESYYLLP